ncbi:O-antigen ligase family protein [Curtobacterium flaccumfaciens]|uniref:O-antigen ligase family protein n=1 Tax=Curtobacterium flaccumfaciens TaxID=2035 RepID=UPI00217F0CBC|nr:O-antigen ligase family protein [Curtobacterium flaccumfaciens]MCS6587746.1 O-antigen ligase family protein [Curtobacterium flaccumfaciens pv. flaccumfaciens]
MVGVETFGRRDFLLRAAWPFMLLGAFSTPMLVFRIGGVTVSDISFIIGGVLVLLSSGRPKLNAQPLVILAAVLGLIAILLASFSAVNISESVAVGVRLLYVWTLWQYTIRVVGQEPTKLTTFALVYALGSAASGLAAIAQTTVGLDIPNSQVVFGRVGGLATHVNGQGGALAAGAAIAFGLFLMRYRRPLTFTALVLSVVGIVLAGSVTGMLGAAIGILSVMIARGVRPQTFFWLIAAGGIAWFVGSRVQALIPGVADPLERLKQATGNSGVYGDVGTLTLRILTDRFAWGRIKENPLTGYGLDSASGYTYDGATATHNMLLLVWFQGGILLLVAVLLILFTAVRRALAKSNRISTNGLVAIGAFAAAFACAMTAPVLFDRFFWLPIVLSLALPVPPDEARSVRGAVARPAGAAGPRDSLPAPNLL